MSRDQIIAIKRAYIALHEAGQWVAAEELERAFPALCLDQCN